MIILLIILLWLISLSLRVTSSGISSLNKIHNKSLENADSDKVDTFSSDVKNTAVKVSTNSLDTIRRVIDILKNLLTALLPSILILDVLVFVMVVSASGGYLLLLEDAENIPARSISTSGGTASSDDDSITVVASGDGAKIVEEAMKYVDVLPYVWGGTSLETGADCSGFVCAVYDKCGYDLWANRMDLVLEGEEVPDIEHAQAGDILIYSGHVAIYDGNGARIHAPGTGQMVTHETNLGDYYAIRRIIT